MTLFSFCLFLLELLLATLKTYQTLQCCHLIIIHKLIMYCQSLLTLPIYNLVCTTIHCDIHVHSNQQFPNYIHVYIQPCINLCTIKSTSIFHTISVITSTIYFLMHVHSNHHLPHYIQICHQPCITLFTFISTDNFHFISECHQLFISVYKNNPTNFFQAISIITSTMYCLIHVHSNWQLPF